MLVLTRRIGEEVVIATDIFVRVVAVKGKQVRLGIQAPSSVSVARPELLSECSLDEGATCMGPPALPSGVAQKYHPR
jgi:carbon storage regulator